MPYVPPLVTLTLAIIVIASSYVLTFRSSALDGLGGQLVTPPISLLMADGPGRLIGQVGFPLISLGFGSCVPALRQGLYQLLGKNDHKMVNYGILAAKTAFVALAVVGALPLQRNIVEVMQGRAQMTFDSMIHQSAAAVFFLGAQAHMIIWIIVTATVESSSPISRASAPISFYFKVSCLVFSFFPLPAAFALHPASPIRSRLNLTDNDAGGLQQYALVVCVASFFASYTHELATFAKLQASPRAAPSKAD